MQPPDIAVYGPDYKLQLVVDVVSRPRASEEWARETRETLLAYKAIPEAPFFLLALPGAFYLWTPATAQDTHAFPEYRIDARQALAPYSRGFEDALETLDPYTLELLVSFWIHDLVYSYRTMDSGSGTDLQWFFESGLAEAIQRGKVVLDVAA
jgi:hypothetical protein